MRKRNREIERRDIFRLGGEFGEARGRFCLIPPVFTLPYTAPRRISKVRIFFCPFFESLSYPSQGW